MPTSELVPLMRAQIAYSTILIASVLGSTLMATAQTGEFALQVPSSVVHRGWEIQDQIAGCPIRNARQIGEPHRRKQRGVEIRETSSRWRQIKSRNQRQR